MENKKYKICYPFLGISLITFIVYLVIEIKNYTSFLNFLPKLLGIIVILLFLICFIIISLRNEKKLTIIFGSILITLYSVFNSLLTLGIISLPSDEFIPNFYNQSLQEVNKWNKERNINIIENYEYSDNVKKNYVKSQDINYPTLVKNVKDLNLTISLGPDYDKEVIIPNFIGLKYDDVMKYIEENYLSNVNFEFVESEDNINTVILQDGSGTRKRSDKITFTVAITTPSEENIPNLTNKSLLYAENYLKMHKIKYKKEYEYSDTIQQDFIIKQSIVDKIVLEDEEVIITVSKGRMILAPDIKTMTEDEINEWILENNLKVTYKEIYSDEVNLGDVVSSSIQKGEAIENGKDIEITISKGNLKMIKLTTISEFTNWAVNNEVNYDIVYEYSDNIKKDEIIKCSHKNGEAIKINDTVIVTVSKGKSITLPNFVGMSKENIKNKCSQLNLNCSFKYGGYTEKTKKDIATSQSKKSNTTVSEGTNLIITLSSGIYEKVNVPNFVNKSKSEISNTCKNLGIKCDFKYAAGYSDTEKDKALSQSKTGTVNKGSTITITLSNGPAKTYTVIIDANQLSSGNPEATKNTLQTKLKNACPGVNFNFKFAKANSGIGYLSINSEVKVGSNKLVQGKTYNVIINSN